MNGLTKQEVENRIKNNQYNYDTDIKTNSISDIIKRNTFTYFNILNLVLFILVLLVGSIKNTLFIIGIFINAIISIIQDIRSKKAIDKLSFISKVKNTAIRDGKEEKINNNEIVLDDILILKTGNQVIVDSIILDGSVEVNESFITGEELPVYKKVNDELLSGSFITSGQAIVKVIRVGKDNYQSKISLEAKYYKKINSIIIDTLNKIIKYISFFLIPIGLAFFYNQHFIVGTPFNSAVLSTVASLITMIPEGLVLLTSTVLAVSVIKLSKQNVLIQELYCIETLARIDTICFDKTGTLTTGNMKVIKEITLNNNYNLKEILSEIGNASTDNNPTINAIRKSYPKTNNYIVEEVYPFSSERKYSGVKFKDKGTYLIGSPENLLNKSYEEYNDYRVISILHEQNEIGLLVIEDEIRTESIDTIEFFQQNGCTIKLISGDNPKTVYNIAKRLNLNIDDKYIDTTNMSEEELKNIANDYTIFGRVTPQGKKILVQAMQKQGHTVAMIGDGVNDVLALKESDCSISISNGSEAARNISKIILVNNDFSKMKNILYEGRRTINNIEKSASLFIVKTIYSSILAVLFVFATLRYPFVPIQLSLISGLTIGIPSIVLALEPNYNLISNEFFKNIIRKALPTAISTVINVFYLVMLSQYLKLDNKTIATIGILIIAINGFLHVDKISRPYNNLRIALMFGIVFTFSLSYIIMRDFFMFATFNFYTGIIALILALNTIIVFNMITTIFAPKKEQ